MPGKRLTFENGEVRDATDDVDEDADDQEEADEE